MNKFNELCERILNEGNIIKKSLISNGKSSEWGLIDGSDNLSIVTFKKWIKNKAPFLDALDEPYDTKKQSGVLYKIFMSIFQNIPFNKRVDINKDIKKQSDVLEKLKILEKIILKYLKKIKL